MASGLTYRTPMTTAPAIIFTLAAPRLPLALLLSCP